MDNSSARAIAFVSSGDLPPFVIRLGQQETEPFPQVRIHYACFAEIRFLGELAAQDSDVNSKDHMFILRLLAALEFDQGYIASSIFMQAMCPVQLVRPLGQCKGCGPCKRLMLPEVLPFRSQWLRSAPVRR